MNTANKLAIIAKNSYVAEDNKRDNTEKILYDNSVAHVDSIISQCTALAEKGYGSVRLTLDRTAKQFGKDEGRNNYYDADLVCKMLRIDHGFFIDMNVDGGNYVDHYDAFTTKLIWINNLPEAPDKFRIKMSTK